ncbi:MAG TPA: VOC family protein [Chloroflexota bacterium]|nr:VOC family protein [Chloroflexota bacterium]
MVKVRKINHLVLRVRDVERTIRFYRDVLGMEVIARVGPGGMAGVFFKFTDNHHDLACFALGPQAEGPYEDQVGMYHVALEVATLEELVAARDELARVGALVGMSDHGLSKSLYVKDPDGNELEILWNIPREEWKDISVAATRPLNLEAELRKYGKKEAASV